MSYRSAPLGLVRRSAVDRLHLELEEGARNGGDLPFATELWFGGRITAALHGPPYIEHADAPVRVTHEAKPVADELAPVSRLLGSATLAGRTRSEREAITLKLFRRNVKGAVLKREAGLGLTPPDLAALEVVCAGLVSYAPRLPRILSRADARLLAVLARSAAAREDATDLQGIAAAYRATEHLRSRDVLLAADLRMMCHREAPLRYMIASAAMR